MLEPLQRTSGPIHETEIGNFSPRSRKSLLLLRWCLRCVVAFAFGFFVFVVVAIMMPQQGWGQIGAIAVIVVAVAAYIVFIYFTRFCPRCHLLLKRRAERQNVQWCEHCEHLLSQDILVPTDGRLSISRSELEQIAHYDPVIELVSLLLFVLVDDEVDFAVLQPQHEDYRFFAMKDGIEFELEPPPREVHHKIIAIVKSIFDANDCYDHSLYVQREYSEYEMVATIAQTEFGERLTIRFNKD